MVNTVKKRKLYTVQFWLHNRWVDMSVGLSYGTAQHLVRSQQRRNPQRAYQIVPYSN